MAYFLSPIGNSQQVTSAGAPLSGGKIYTYLAGSSTFATTYCDNLGVTQQANPIILNSLGLPSSPIWFLGGVSVKFVILDSLDVPIRTIDYISGVNDTSTTTTVNEWVASGLTPTYVNGTTFSVAGDQRGVFQVGRRVLTANTAGSIYSTIATSTFSVSTTTVTLTNDSGSLDSGLSAVSYGLISVTNTSLPAISTSGVITFGGPTVTLTVASGSGSYAVRTAAGSEAAYVLATASTSRWTITKNTGAETGSNVGSDFTINRFNDAGSFINTPVYITRSTGAITFAGAVNTFPNATGTGTVSFSSLGAGQQTQVQIQSNGGTRWQFLKDSDAESGSNAGSTLYLQAYSDAGGFVANVFSVARATGVLTFTSTPVIPSSSAVFNTQTGSAPSYALRTWVRFNGATTGTNAPISGGNVSTVTRNGTGDYTINFTTALPDANYAFVGTCSRNVASETAANALSGQLTANQTTTSLRVLTFSANSSSSVAADMNIVTLVIVR
jgi:hypothetical protein